MSVVEKYRITESFIKSDQFFLTLEDGEFYYPEQIYANIHRYLPFSILIRDFMNKLDKHGYFAVQTEQRVSVNEFLLHSGEPMFTYMYDSSRGQTGAYCNVNGTWSIMQDRVFLKDSGMISALKLAFG